MKKAAKKWYAVTANYKAVHLGKVRRRHLWEQTVFLVMAANDDDAQVISYKIAKSKEHEYKAVRGANILAISWHY